MTVQRPVLPITDLYGSDKRIELVQFLLDQPEDEWFPKKHISDNTDVSQTTISDHLGPTKESGKILESDIVKYGVADIRDLTANHPYYRRADTDVVDGLLWWHIERNGYPLAELLEFEGRRKLVAFFLEQANPDEEYNRSEIAEKTNSNYSTVNNHIGVLVDAGLVEEVGEGYGTGYRLNADSALTSFLWDLNAVLVETYRERSD